MFDKLKKRIIKNAIEKEFKKLGPEGIKRLLSELLSTMKVEIHPIDKSITIRYKKDF